MVFCVCVVLKTPSFLLSPILQHVGITNQRQNVLMTVRASSAHGMSSKKILSIRMQMGVSHMWGGISPQWHLLKYHLWNLGPGYHAGRLEELLILNRPCRSGEDVHDSVLHTHTQDFLRPPVRKPTLVWQELLYGQSCQHRWWLLWKQWNLFQFRDPVTGKLSPKCEWDIALPSGSPQGYCMPKCLLKQHGPHRCISRDGKVAHAYSPLV